MEAGEEVFEMLHEKFIGWRMHDLQIGDKKQKDCLNRHVLSIS